MVLSLQESSAFVSRFVLVLSSCTQHGVQKCCHHATKSQKQNLKSSRREMKNGGLFFKRSLKRKVNCLYIFFSQIFPLNAYSGQLTLVTFDEYLLFNQIFFFFSTIFKSLVVACHFRLFRNYKIYS